MRLCIVLALVLVLATSAFALEKRAYQIKEDFGTEPLYDCTLNYYYYIPCPTYTWIWIFSGWTTGDIQAHCFNVGEQGTGTAPPCDPTQAQALEQIRVLDWAGYGTVYPGLFTVEYDVYCAPEPCCGPTAPFIHLWNSGPYENILGYNYIVLDPPLSLCECWDGTADPYSIVVTATHTGTDGQYPAWCFDNIASNLRDGCVMHDSGCLPAAFPRNWCGGPDPRVHSGYVGQFPFQYWPPLCYLEPADTAGGAHLGCIEFFWRIYLINSGPTATQPSTWGSIKSMYE